MMIAVALPPPPAYHSAHMELSAEVDRGDWVGATGTVMKTKKGEQHFTVTSTTKKDGIATGQNVVVHYTMDGKTSGVVDAHVAVKVTGDAATVAVAVTAATSQPNTVSPAVTMPITVEATGAATAHVAARASEDETDQELIAKELSETLGKEVKTSDVSVILPSMSKVSVAAPSLILALYSLSW